LPSLEIIDLKASYGSTPVLDGISVSIATGGVLGLIGPSGSGKSTVLRVLVGLLKPSSGRVLLDGREIDYASASELKGIRDRLAIVFQQYNLFQNMNVLDNVTIAPVKIRGRARGAVEEEAQRLLDKVGLGDKLRPIRMNCQEASSSVSRSRVHWRSTPRYSSSTKLRPRWTPSWFPRSWTPFGCWRPKE